VVVGTGGTILTTSDGGVTWRSRTSGTKENLYAVTCLTSRACLAVGTGTILASADGGATWTVRSSGNGNDLRAVTCRTARACLAVGGGVAMDSGGVLMTSADGGATWTSRLLHSGDLYAVTCLTSMACLAGGALTLLTSADGGATWTSVREWLVRDNIQHHLPAQQDLLARNRGQHPAQRGRRRHVARWLLLRDLGRRRDLAKRPQPLWSICHHVHGGQVPVHTRRRRRSHRASTDGGATWHVTKESDQGSPGRIPFLGAGLLGIACPTSGSCLAVGSGGTIIASMDGGTTWTFRSAAWEMCALGLTSGDPLWIAACK